ncbi:MAG: hypothetical protein AAGH72_07890 [Verrucomicrobiota bacterium]
MDSKTVLMIGLHPASVNYEKWPELSPVILKQAFDETVEKMTEAGYHAEWCLTDTGETAEDQVMDALKAKQPDIVLIGAGVRTDPDHLTLFVRLLNLIRIHAPSAAIAFNTSPHDSVDAVQRVS